MKKVMVFGGSGALGISLCEVFVKNHDYELYVAARVKKNDEFPFFSNYHVISDSASIRSLISYIKPDLIVNCVGSYSNDFQKDLTSNVVFTDTILSIVSDLGLESRIVLIGSSAEYGIVNCPSVAIPETHQLNPVNYYGLTKKMQHDLMIFYSKSKGLDVVMCRLFNLVSPLLSERLFVGSLFAQAKLFSRGEISKINVRTLAGSRDYMLAENASRAILLVAKFGKSGEVYNVGSGKLTSLRRIAESVLENFSIPLSEVVVVDEVGSDNGAFFADISKLQKLSLNQLDLKNNGL